MGLIRKGGFLSALSLSALISLLYIVKFSDFIFHGLGINLLLLYLLGLFAFFSQKNINFSHIVFFFICFVIQIFYSYFSPDSLIFFMALFSLYFIYSYFKSSADFNIFYVLIFVGIFNLIFNFHFYEGNIAINTKGYLGQINFNALLLNIFSFSILYMIANSKSRFFNIILWAALVISVYLSVVTQSRAALLSVVVVFILIFTDIKFFSRNTKNVFLSFIILYFIIFLANTFLYDSSAVVKAAKFGGMDDNNIIDRFVIWLSQIIMFFEKPLSGHGLETFKFINNPYQLKSIDILKYYYDNISNFTWGHNEVLQLLAEGGILIGIPIVIFVAKKIYYIFKTNRNDVAFDFFIKKYLLLLILIQSMFSWQLRYPFYMALFTILLAIAPDERVNTKWVIQNNNKYFSYIKYPLIVIFIVFNIFYMRLIYLEFPAVYKLNVKKEVDEPKILNLVKNDFFWFELAGNFIHYKVGNMMEDAFDGKIPAVKSEFAEIEDRYKKYCSGEYDYLLEISKRYASTHKIWIAYIDKGLLEILTCRYDDAYKTTKMGLDLNPGSNFLWNANHFASVLNISETQDVDIYSLLPEKLLSLEGLIPPK